MVVMVSESEPAQLCLFAFLCFEIEATIEERNYSFGRVQKRCNKALFFWPEDRDRLQLTSFLVRHPQLS